MLRWFMNCSPGSGSKVSTTTTSRATPKCPRATNGVSVFAEEHKAKITERMAEQQEQEGGNPKWVNLTHYHSIRQTLYDQLTEEEQREYEGKAAKKNEASKTQPETSEIFK